MEKTEKEIKQFFSELRAEDSQWAPAFSAITRPAPTFTATGSRFRFALGTITVLLLIATIAVTSIHLHTRSLERQSLQWAALSTWEAPTDALLSISSLPWGSSVTAPSDSLLNNSPDPSGTTLEKL